MVISKKVNISEFWGIALMLCVLLESIVNKLLVTIVPVDNLLGYVMLIIAVIVIVTNRLYLNLDFMMLYTACWILLLLSVIFVRGEAVREYIFQFISFGSCGVLCAMTQIDFKKFYKTGAIFTIIFLIITYAQNYADARVSPFAFGYALVPGWIITFYNIYNAYQERRHIQMCIWSCTFAAETYFLFRFCSRGNLVQIYVFAILCLMLLFHKKILGWLGIAAGITVVVFIEPIIIVLYEIMESLGIYISVIGKSYWLLTTPSETLMHGRTELLAASFEGINVWNVLFGRGVGGYENMTGTYSHNIFSQAFNELGIIGVMLIGALFFFFMKVMLDQKNELYEKEFYMMLFTVVLVKLIFSSVYWRTSGFWLLVLTVYVKLRKRNRNVIIRV